MADNLANGPALRQTLIECLTDILSPEHHVRSSAEERLKLLEVTEEYGVHLAQLSVDGNGALPIRQLASVVLKQYVQVHWSSLSEKFILPETTIAAKAAIRELLPHGLQDPANKVRSSVAYAISGIAHWDWPESWPDLFEKLMHALLSEDGNLIHGAMRVLTEFSREVTDAQIPQVAPIVLPQMCLILTEDKKYSIRIRSRAVDIFNTFAELVGTMKSTCKQLFPILENFTNVLTQVLAVPDGETSDCGLKMEVLKALTTLITNFRKQMAPHLANILPHVWSTLTQGADRYRRTVVNCIDEFDDPVDSDGEILGFETVIFSIFEFIHVLIESSKFKAVVKTHLEQLLYFLLVYMEITEDQVCAWSSDPNRYVEDEDDETFSFSVRISAQNLLLSLASEMKDETAVCLVQALYKHLQESRLARSSGEKSWWKVDESCMLAIGSIQPLISEKVAKGQLQFDIPSFLTEVVLPALDTAASPFLIGRALWFSSRFTREMQPDLLARFLQVTVGGLSGNQVPAIRIGATRAIFGYCDHLKSTGNSSLIRPYLPEILNNLLNMAMQYNEDALSLVLETLSIVMNIDKGVTASWEQKITPFVIALFLKHGQDPALSPILEEIFRELAYNEACLPILQQRFLPTIVSLLESPQDKVPLGIRPVALDILCHIVRASHHTLSDALINIFPSLVAFILRSDDNAILQSGGECVRAYVAKGSEQLLNWHDSASNNGIAYVVQVISHLLHPQICEYASAFVGKLIIILAKKVGQNMGDKLDLILRETLSKLQQAETLTVIQSLMMVFISLMYHRLQDTLGFLCNVPDPSGKPALEFVVNIWCSRQQEFFGTYDSKVRILSMCKILEYTIHNGDRRLNDIIVKGDRRFDNETGIRTRSKAAKQPEQWTMIPAPLKFYKMILEELSNLIQNQEGVQEESDDDDDDEWEDDDEDVSEDLAMKQLLSSVIAPASDYPGFDNLYDDYPHDEVEDDPDILQDPIYSMDIQNYLVEFLRAFSRHPSFSTFNNELGPKEKQTLVKAGIIQ